ncbi:MAG: sulfotransferase [Paracoccaceae bacterium]|nr:sulfotransferase [Paracoccaceae bacterium]
MQGQPTLLFGVGAAKSGTTWLYSYLARHAECHLRSIKELHYFDADAQGARGHARQIRLLEAQVAEVEGKIAVAEGMEMMWLAKQAADLHEMIAVHRGEEPYVDYLTRDAGAARVVADITPAYSMLSVEGLRRMLAVSPLSKVVYVMRDPIERLWSHVRMHAAEGRAPAEGARRARRRMDQVLSGTGAHSIAERGDYAAVIAKLRAIVPAERLLVEFYERLITESGVRRLCAFLGIGYQAAQLTQRILPGVPVQLDARRHAAAAAYLAPQYRFVEQTFGALPESWQANLARV